MKNCRAKKKPTAPKKLNVNAMRKKKEAEGEYAETSATL